jgi:hypothetical protein
MEIGRRKIQKKADTFGYGWEELGRGRRSASGASDGRLSVT